MENNKSVYIIGEIGQNHNGSVDIAKLIIDMVSREIEEPDFNLKLKGMDAVKLTKRDLNYELTQSEMNRPYNSIHSFGKTYGEHRAFLELNDEQHFEVYKHAKSFGLDFVETLCAPSCLSIFKYFTPDYLKVASRDLTNLPLLEELASTKVPIIISTGMAGKKELDEAVNLISKYHSRLSILHCVSQYPTHPENVNLLTVQYLIKHYSKYIIGYSDHTIGIATPLMAVAMGAKVIEKHITLDRRMKGTDQAGSLGPEGVHRMVRDIRLFEKQLGIEDIYIEPSVKSAKEKLERSIASNKDLEMGQVISEDDIHLLSPGNGFKWSEKDKVLGKKLKISVAKNELILSEYIQQ
ncbi:MAG: N-acetylneuraminate synthase family protein [Luteibaculaceae bacterium]